MNNILEFYSTSRQAQTIIYSRPFFIRSRVIESIGFKEVVLLGNFYFGELIKKQYSVRKLYSFFYEILITLFVKYTR